MNIQSLVRVVALSALACVFLATAIVLSLLTEPKTETVEVKPPVKPISAFDAELERCKARGVDTTNDAVCTAVWQANRKRFFESGQDQSTDPRGTFLLPVPQSPARTPLRPSEPSDASQ